MPPPQKAKQLRAGSKRAPDSGDAAPLSATSTAADETLSVPAAVAAQLTRYEKTKVIGTRAEQIARGAPVFIGDVLDEDMSFYDIAERELAEGKLPFIVARTMPDGSVSHMRLSTR